MGSSYSKLEKGKIKKYQSKTDRIFYNSVALIAIVFLLGFSLFIFTYDRPPRNNAEAKIPILFFCGVFLFFLIIWFKDNTNRKKKEQLSIDETMDFNKFNYQSDEEYKLMFVSKLDEITIVINQIVKVTNSLQEVNLAIPEDLDYYEENASEFLQYVESLLDFLNNHKVPL